MHLFRDFYGKVGRFELFDEVRQASAARFIHPGDFPSRVATFRPSHNNVVKVRPRDVRLFPAVQIS